MTTMAATPVTVTGGVDTHADLHVAAALDELGRVLGTASFPTSVAGYRRLHGWLADAGVIDRVGVEGPAATAQRSPAT
jgi:transposase